MSMFSFYIPRIDVTVATEVYVKNVFAEAGVGKVSRVDFTSIDKKVGFSEEDTPIQLSAFVHFEQLYKNKLTELILVAIKDETPFKFFPHQTTATPPKFQDGYRRRIGGSFYWLILKNLTPVVQTRLNTSQIVENCRFLERTVSEQADKIALLENKLANCVEAVNQLIGGLWNQRTQHSVIEVHQKALLGESASFNPEKVEKDTSKWGIWPTTRQGDTNEVRIENLERQLSELTAQDVYPAYEAWRNDTTFEIDLDDDLNSIGSPLSISELKVEKFSVVSNDETETSIPPLIPLEPLEPLVPLEINDSDDSDQTRDTNVSKRVANSYDLCGNE